MPVVVRSALAVLAGFVLIGALAAGTDALVRSSLPGSYGARGATDSVPLLLLSQLYVGVYAVVGCWLAARLAPSRPMRHALALGVLGLAFNAMGSAARWDLVPMWYHVVGLGLTLPYAWLGGTIRERQLRSAGATRTALA